MPVPVTGDVDVIDNQLLFAVAVQSQVVPAVTVIVSVDAVAATDAEVADSSGPHGAELANVFDNWLATIRPVLWPTLAPDRSCRRRAALAAVR